MAGQQADDAGVVAPPPIFFGIPLVVGLLLNRALPLRWQTNRGQACGNQGDPIADQEQP